MASCYLRHGATCTVCKSIINSMSPKVMHIALLPAINKATKKQSCEKISAFHTTTNICERLFAQWLLPPHEMSIPLQTINDTNKSLHSF